MTSRRTRCSSSTMHEATWSMNTPSPTVALKAGRIAVRNRCLRPRAATQGPPALRPRQRRPHAAPGTPRPMKLSKLSPWRLVVRSLLISSGARSTAISGVKLDLPPDEAALTLPAGPASCDGLCQRREPRRHHARPACSARSAEEPGRDAPSAAPRRGADAMLAANVVNVEQAAGERGIELNAVSRTSHRQASSATSSASGRHRATRATASSAPPMRSRRLPDGCGRRRNTAPIENDDQPGAIGLVGNTFERQDQHRRYDQPHRCRGAKACPDGPEGLTAAGRRPDRQAP